MTGHVAILTVLLCVATANSVTQNSVSEPKATPSAAVAAPPGGKSANDLRREKQAAAKADALKAKQAAAERARNERQAQQARSEAERNAALAKAEDDRKAAEAQADEDRAAQAANNETAAPPPITPSPAAYLRDTTISNEVARVARSQGSLWWLLILLTAVVLVVGTWIAWGFRALRAAMAGGEAASQRRAADNALAPVYGKLDALDRAVHEIGKRIEKIPTAAPAMVPVPASAELASLRELIEERLPPVEDRRAEPVERIELEPIAAVESASPFDIFPSSDTGLAPTGRMIDPADQDWADRVAADFDAVVDGRLTPAAFVDRYDPLPVAQREDAPSPEVRLCDPYLPSNGLLSIVAFQQDVQRLLLLPRMDAISRWGMFLINNGGVPAREHFGRFFTLEPGEKLSMQKCAIVERVDSSNFRMVEGGALKGLR